ncbi:MAG: cyclic-di-AMP receptor [Eubacteriales bacterium]|nr:cyclic-di-AMP receptor [Eubacteriales bacterium]
MKLIYAIIRNDNEDDVVSALNREKYSVTKLATTGGFLRKGNVTLMIGTDDDRVEPAIELIRRECGHRQNITVNMPYISGTSMVNYATMPMNVEVGGATIFVVNVDRFEKF